MKTKSSFIIIFIVSFLFGQEEIIHISKIHRDGTPKEVIVYERVTDDLHSDSPFKIIRKTKYDTQGKYIRTKPLSPAKTPSDLLITIHMLATKEDYAELENHIYPFQEQYSNTNTRDDAIKGIKQNYTWNRGDFAYSNDALKEVIDNHLDKFIPASKENDSSIFWSIQDDETLKKLGQEYSKYFKVFNFKGVYIFTVKEGGRYQLLFWENLNKILD